jgi:hypothetical protein
MMKKTFYICSALIVVVLSIFSCAKDDTSIDEKGYKSGSSSSLTARSNEEEEETFAEDSRLIDLYNSLRDLKPATDETEITRIHNQLKNLYSELASVYGEEDIDSYVQDFISTNRPGLRAILH